MRIVANTTNKTIRVISPIIVLLLSILSRFPKGLYEL